MSQENGKIWYLFVKDVVSGPFNHDEIKRLAKTAQYISGTMIWRKGQSEWTTFESWLSAFTENAIHNPSFDDTWYIMVGGLNSGPFTLAQIGQNILEQNIPLSAKLWTSGLKRWVTVFDIKELVQHLGLPMRRSARAPFVGEVNVMGFFKTQKVSATTLSNCGIGLSGLNAPAFTSRISLRITSELLTSAIEAKARIVSIKGPTAGLEFTEISPRGAQVLKDYVKQFEVNLPPAKTPLTDASF